MNAHERIEDLIAAFALGSLDGNREEAQREILEHTTGCERCRALYAEFRETAADLALSAPAQSPPAGLEQKILERVRGVPPTAAARRGRTISMRLGALAAAVTLVLVGSLAAFAASLSNRVNDAEKTSAMMIQALSVVARPDAKSMMMSGSMPGTLMLTYRPDGQAVLVGSHVAAPHRGMMFELWAVKGSTSVPVDVFMPADGMVVLPMELDMAGVDALMVTEEPGMMSKPSGKRLWSVEM